MLEGKSFDPLSSLSEFLGERGRGLEQASGDQLRQEILRQQVLRGVYGLGGKY
jgi:hypothetical protein